MALAGYKLRINGGALVNQITDVGNVLTHDFTGLTPATPYAVEVASYDNAVPPNQSAWSAPITVSTDTPIVPIALVASISATADGSNVSLTGAINTAGASLLVMAATAQSGFADVPTDSKGNTWLPLTSYASVGGNGRITLFYAANPTVGSGHTFGCSVSQYHSIYVAAFSNVAAITPFDLENGAGNVSATTQQPGSITPGGANRLVITALQFVAPSGVASIDSGFTAIGSRVDGVNFAVSLAYKVQSAAAAVNPTWTSPAAADRMAATIASFKHG